MDVSILKGHVFLEATLHLLKEEHVYFEGKHRPREDVLVLREHVSPEGEYCLLRKISPCRSTSLLRKYVSPEEGAHCFYGKVSLLKKHVTPEEGAHCSKGKYHS